MLYEGTPILPSKESSEVHNPEIRKEEENVEHYSDGDRSTKPKNTFM